METETEVGLQPLAQQLSEALDRLEAAGASAKRDHQARLRETTLELLQQPDGVAALYAQAPRFDTVGVFGRGDRARPASLQPALVSSAIRGEPDAVAVETLSELRLLAIAAGEASSDEISAAEARGFLESVLALNLDLLFPAASEASRAQQTLIAEGVHRLFRFLADRLGMGGVLASLIAEAERLLFQRPIMVQRIRTMIEAAAEGLAEVEDPEVRRVALLAVRGPPVRFPLQPA